MALSDVSPDPARPHARGARQPDALVESYRRLAEVFHHVLSEQSLDTLLDRIADTLAELVPYDALQIYEADNTRRELIPVLARSEWENEIMRTRPAFGQGITGWAVVNREPVLANQAHLDTRVAFIPGTPAEPEALVSIPLIARGSLKGALNIYRLGETASFDDDEFELAKWFGDAAALALDNAQVRARLEHQAQTDSLTGLYNHRNFHERLRAELMRASRARDSVALLMFDIDEFKRVNDICGHAAGDQILVEIAELTNSLVRASDVVCRLGGEEFAVIMPSCNAGDALGLARRLTERLGARPVDAAGEITVSVGIAHGPENAGNPRDLVDCAESAMMAAKARGKNRIVVYAGDIAERPDALDAARDVRSVAHLKMLQSVAARLNRLNSVKDIAEAIVSELRGLIDYHSCRVYLVEGNYVVPVAVKGDGVTEERQVQALRIELGTGITGHVAETGHSVLAANAYDCEHALLIPGTERVDESVIAVPLRYGARVAG
ncbi:MAG: diguanylate cyclase, partial [Gaiellales bacterium]